ncbi:hypothetical protein Cylst_1420 [Cylindrospermum stagnale PCC 7417]|uniref:N-acetyltransferase domain-containing protein n=1 Tax=Cylindrospermum stagnale PCC 7417 TaxID=56107 RepID=K9WW23_9NOST|nr:hypothetical protein [Cylindrospermum stagnale]AFZ23707.1 hypothetical protein Cylst_1420 [Cylindrospermum stagnale PCC 7417]
MLVKDGIIYQLLAAPDLEATINCMAEAFPNSEPLTTALGITIDEFYPFAELVCIQAVEEGLSHIAKDANTGKVIGFRISEDLIQEESEENNTVINSLIKFYPIISLLKDIKEAYLRDKIIQKGQVLHFIMVGVQKNYRNLNIAKNLITENLGLAEDKKFTTVICEATGKISQHNARKLGFNEIVAIEYKDYLYQGLKVFEKIEPHAKCILMEKII